MASYPSVPPTLLGHAYPKGCMTAILHSLRDAEKAADALVTVGYGRTNVVAASGARLLENEAHIASESSLMDRVLRRFPSREGEITSQYTELARGGSAIVILTMPESTVEDRQVAAGVLRTFGASNLNYFGDYSIESL